MNDAIDDIFGACDAQDLTHLLPEMLQHVQLIVHDELHVLQNDKIHKLNKHKLHKLFADWQEFMKNTNELNVLQNFHKLNDLELHKIEVAMQLKLHKLFAGWQLVMNNIKELHVLQNFHKQSWNSSTGSAGAAL